MVDDDIDLTEGTIAIKDYRQKLEIVNNMKISEFCHLEELGIHFYDESLREEGSYLSNLMGAIITDSIVPYITTHVVAEKQTPVLKMELISLEEKLSEKV